MTLNRYYYKLRQPAPGCQPKAGLVSTMSLDECPYVHSVGCHAWGVCWYDRELSDEEMEAYDLVPVPCTDSVFLL